MMKTISIINAFFLIVGIILAVIALIHLLVKNDSFTVKDDKNKDNLLLLIIGIVFVGIRLWKFGLVPGGFNQDGAMAAVDGLALSMYGTDRFGTWMPAHLCAWGYGQMSALLSYLIAFFVKLFGLSITVARLPQLLVSLMGGVFFYLFVRDNFGKKAGLIAAFFVAINPWHFMQSRWALDCNLLPHFFMTGLYFFSKGLLKQKYFIYISMIFFALSMYCYGITIYTIPLFLLAIAIYYYIKKKLTVKDIVISVVIYLAIAWPFILTMMVNYFKWDTIKLPFVTIQYFPDSVRANDILFFSNNIGKQLITNVTALLDKTVFQKRDLLWNDITNFGTMYYFTLPFIIVGIIGLWKIKTTGNKALVVFALLAGVWVGLVTNNVNVNRINIIYYGMMMISVIGIYYLLMKVKYAKWIVPAMYIILGILFINTYFTSYSVEIAKVFYDGFGEAVKKVTNSAADKIYITTDLQGNSNLKVGEILTLFYDKTDAKYYQGKTNINNGKEYLPYKERFIYERISDEIIDEDNASYIIMCDDMAYFDENIYDINRYGNYCAVIKKQV